MTQIKFICLCLCFFLCSCGKSPTASAKPQILVSIAPYRLLTEEIAGDGFDVRTVVPVNADPHSFEPTSNQVTDMTKGLVWFRIGEPFEGKILPILKGRNPTIVISDLREGIAMIEEGELSCKHCSMDHYDRHIWLSPKMAMVQAKKIEETLSARFPEKAPFFQKNREALQEKLALLDAEITSLLEPVIKRVLLVSHPAFGYFCKDYGFEQISVEYEGKDPRPKHLEEIMQKALVQSIHLALAIPQYNNKGAQIIANRMHMPIRFINPYSADYFETMRKLAHLVADPYAE